MPGIQVFCDRGGTFCDVIARVPDQEDIVIKLLSHDPANYKDAPTEGIRRVLERSLGKEIKRGDKIDTSAIDYIRLSTTVATNALLERKGEKHVLVTTKGFRDLLEIGNQSRPDIFALNIRKPEVLYSAVLEVDERVTLVGYASDPHVERNSVKFDQHGKVSRAYKGHDHPPPAADGRDADIVQGESGEAVAILKKPDEQQLEEDLKRLYDEGYRAAAIVLMHSYTYPEHERIVEEIAKRVGFTHISVSSKLMPMIKIVPRGTSSTADAYLTPILKQYIDGFFNGFEGSLRDGTAGTRVEFMMSDGGLTSVERFSGLKSIISGPAGGVVGMALTSYWKEDGRPIIGLDMGGTSTDVSRFAGRYEQVFETTLAGVTIQSPQLDINTVASGGSSRLFWRNGLFVVGPESASAHPGPTCYRKGGPLAITDANLVTGRLPTEKFPKIFGPKENESLDEETTRIEFEKLREEINNDTGRELSLDETAQGFIRIANELMARPIRALTEARGYSASKHILACFGGAGGQHACSIARSLGIKTVLIHKYSSILSAYGMALANRVHEAQAPSSETWGSEGALERVQKRVEELQEKVKSELHKEGFKDDRLEVEVLLNLRYEGTDTALMSLKPNDSWDMEKVFVDTYKQEFGFVLSDKPIRVDDVRVRGIGKSYDTLPECALSEARRLDFSRVDASALQETTMGRRRRAAVYFDGGHGRVDTPLVELDKTKAGEMYEGPALLIDQTQTLLIEPACVAKITSQAVIVEILYDEQK